MNWSYSAALDGLRTVAVYLVLLFHTGMSVAAGGFVGVDLFFVLSGFLVTNVILSEIDRDGRLSLSAFYARRVRRLLPAAVVVIVATCLVYLLVFPVASRLALVGDARSALLYFANWNFLLQQNDYFAAGVDESPFLHFWSLAIEEQFYVVFPVLLAVLAKVARRRPWAMLATLVALLLLSLCSQLYWAAVDTNWAYYGTDARLYQLLAGAVLAVALRSGFRFRGPRAAGATAFVGLVALLAIGSSLVDTSASTRGIMATVASVTVIAALMAAPNGLVGRALALPLPVYLGKISYGTYLWHWPVILVVGQVLEVRPLVLAALAAVISTSLASLSFKVLEHPIRGAAMLQRFRWRVAIAGVATSALVAVAVVTPLLESPRRPRLAAPTLGAATAPVAEVTGSGVSDRERQAPVPRDLDWEASWRGDESYPLCSADDRESCTLVRSGGPHVLLVGDSYGSMFTPMFVELAKEHGFTLSHNAVPACPWQSELIITKRPKAQIEDCRAQREAWYDEVLPALDVDLVVVTSMHRDSAPEVGRDDAARWPLARPGGSDETRQELLYATTRETVDQITSTGARVLMVESLPVPQEGDPMECLGVATKVGDCSIPLPAEPPSDAHYRTVASLSDDAYTVDLSPLFCHGAPVCLPVVDGVAVWGDKNHLTVAYTQHRREEVWEAIQRSGSLKGLIDSNA